MAKESRGQALRSAIKNIARSNPARAVALVGISSAWIWGGALIGNPGGQLERLPAPLLQVGLGTLLIWGIDRALAHSPAKLAMVSVGSWALWSAGFVLTARAWARTDSAITALWFDEQAFDELAGTTVATLAAVLCVVIGLKVALVAQLRIVYREPPKNDNLKPLPFQRATIDDLVDRASQTDHSGLNLIQLEGGWGSGKSTILSEAVAQWRSPEVEDRPAVTRIDAMQAETELSAHKTLVRAILATPEHNHDFRWLRFPAGLALPTDWSLGAVIGRLKRGGAEIEATFTPPSLPHQAALETALESSHRRGIRTIIAIDELDRATPQAAQAFVSLLRRSLDRPGVVVVLSYVEEHVYFKAFNPAVDMLPDLRSSFLALIARRDPVYALDVIDKHEHAGDLIAEYDRALTERFLAMPLLDRREIQSAASEKYLGVGNIRVREMTAEDVGKLCANVEGIWGPISERIDVPKEAFEKLVAAKVQAARTPGTFDVDEPPPAAPVRRLRNEIQSAIPALLDALAPTEEEGTNQGALRPAEEIAYAIANLDFLVSVLSSEEQLS